MNQANPNPLNYAPPVVSSPGVQLLSDGSDGTFLCRISPRYKPGFWRNAFPGLVSILAGVIFAALLFLDVELFHVQDFNGRVKMFALPLCFIIPGVWVMGSAWARKNPDLVEFAADATGMKITLNGKVLAVISRAEILDIWFKRQGLRLFSNVTCALRILLTDGRVVRFLFRAQGRVALESFEEILHKTLGITRHPSRVFAFSRDTIDLRKGYIP